MKFFSVLFLLFSIEIAYAKPKPQKPKATTPQAPQFGSVSGKVKQAPESSSSSLDGLVVYVTGYNESPGPDVYKMDQKNSKFIPDVLPITQGSSVEFSNADLKVHNVFSSSKSATFDLGMSKKNETKKHTFNNTGVIEVYCNIHPEMVGTLLVLPNRAFAMVGKDGSYKIDRVPVGTHSIHLWHRLIEPQGKPLKIEAGKDLQLDWEAKITRKLLPHMDKNGRPYSEHDESY